MRIYAISFALADSEHCSDLDFCRTPARCEATQGHQPTFAKSRQFVPLSCLLTRTLIKTKYAMASKPSLSRRNFLKTAALTTAVVPGAGLLHPSAAQAGIEGQFP